MSDPCPSQQAEDLRQQVISNTVLVIRDPQAQIVAKLRDLMSAYPGTEAKVGGCDKA